MRARPATDPTTPPTILGVSGLLVESCPKACVSLVVGAVPVPVAEPVDPEPPYTPDEEVVWLVLEVELVEEPTLELKPDPELELESVLELELELELEPEMELGLRLELVLEPGLET